MSTSDADQRAVAAFLYREARLADEARYAEWLELWTDDGVYWVPATTDPGADPASRPASSCCRPAGADGELVAGSNFILAELAVQAGRELHWWAGRATHRLRRVDGDLRMSRKTVVLVNAAEPLPNLAFLI